MTTILKQAGHCCTLASASLLFACGTTSPAAVGANDGCYALTVGPWSVVPEYGLPMPRVIQLAPSRDHPWRKWLPNDTGYHVARAWQPDGSPSPAFDLWRHTEADSIKVSPFLRTAGYRLMLAEGDPPLAGTVTFSTDAVPPDPPPPPRATVMARPTLCPTPEETDRPR